MPRNIGELLLAMTVFVGGHLLLSTERLRSTTISRVGQRLFLGIYSLIAAGSLVWLVWSYVNAPYIELWPQTRWARQLPVIIMPFAMILIVCGYSSRNPTAIRQDKFLSAQDPAPGLLKVTRHPIMWGIALWAASHIPANGDVASLILFGGLLLLALGGAAHMDRRRRATHASEWQRFAAKTSYFPFAAIIAGRTQFSPGGIGWTRLLLALVAFIALLFLHNWVIGVSAWPG